MSLYPLAGRAAPHMRPLHLADSSIWAGEHAGLLMLLGCLGFWLVVGGAAYYLI